MRPGETGLAPAPSGRPVSLGDGASTSSKASPVHTMKLPNIVVTPDAAKPNNNAATGTRPSKTSASKGTGTSLANILSLGFISSSTRPVHATWRGRLHLEVAKRHTSPVVELKAG